MLRNQAKYLVPVPLTPLNGVILQKSNSCSATPEIPRLLQTPNYRCII